MKPLSATGLSALLVLLCSHASAKSCPVPDIARSCGSVTSCSISLDGSCVFSGGITITRSNVNLDCQGASFVGNGSGIGIAVDGRDGAPVFNVAIRNCTVSGFQDGMRFGHFQGPDAAPFTKSTSSVLVQGSVSRDNSDVGMRFVSSSALIHVLNSQILNNAGPGLYLSYGSALNTIASCTISGNGHGTKREGISIDSSQSNTIRGNTISNNRAGGIFLFRNCGENHSPVRPFSSDHNLIESNFFDLGTTDPGNDLFGGGVAVWIASRMTRDLSGQDCTLAPYHTTSGLLGTSRYYEDAAEFNVVRSNSFIVKPNAQIGLTILRPAQIGVKVEDNNNTVTSNTFVTGLGPAFASRTGAAPSVPAAAVLVDARFRPPLTGLVMTYNQTYVDVPTPSGVVTINSETGQCDAATAARYKALIYDPGAASNPANSFNRVICY